MKTSCLRFGEAQARRLHHARECRRRQPGQEEGGCDGGGVGGRRQRVPHQQLQEEREEILSHGLVVYMRRLSCS